jgi:hypothetical protein
MALSKCVKLLRHYTEDASHKPVALAAPYDPNFTSSAKLSAALAAAMSEERTPERFPDVDKLGISTFAQCNVTPFRLGVALVDLTGPARLAQPEYAGFNDTTIISCASIFKLAPMLAAHQLKFDVLAKVASAPSTITDTAKKLTWAFGELIGEWKSKGLDPYSAPHLRKIMVVTKGGDVDLDPTFDKWMRAITGPSSFGLAAAVNEMNQGASYLIDHLNWTYIASVLLQTGITDTTDGGLWVSGVGPDTKKYWICEADGAHVTPTTKSNSPQQITAVSGARFLTLITQEVLISEQIAQDFRVVLDGDLGWLMNGLATANSTGGSFSNLARFNPDLANNLDSVRVFGKPGAYGPWAGEALGIERHSAHGPLRYVVVVVTEQFKAGLNYFDMLNFVTRALIPMLDGVIVANNTP